MKIRRSLGLTIALTFISANFALTPTSSGFSASITNSNNTAGSAQAFTCASAQTANGALLEQYYLNEPTGSKRATDHSGNGYNGVYQGSMVSDTGAGLACPRDSGGAYVLNGSTSYVSTAHAVTNPSTFSLETWFKTTTTTGGMLMGFGSSKTGASSRYDRHIYMTNTGNLVFGVYPGYVVTIQSPNAYNDGQWHQVVVTLSSAGMDLYVDGSLVAANSAVTTAQNFTGYWRLGYDNLNGWTNKPTSDYFAGEMRFAAVYANALSSTQVANDYIASTATGTPPTATTCALSQSANGGLAEQYYLNEPTGSTSATDNSGNGYTGTYQGSMTSDTGAGLACPRDPGGAYILDGSTSYVSTPTAFAPSNTFSLELWFKTTTTVGGMLVGFGNSATGLSTEYDRHIYMTNTGNLVFGVYPNAVVTIQSPNAYNDGKWHQVVATLSGSGMALYVDGSLVASSSATTTAQNFTGYWRLGYDNLNGWTNQPTSDYFAGEMRFAAIYANALTPTQVASDYSASL